MSELRNAAEQHAGAGYLYQPEQGETRWMGETSTRFLATGLETDGAFCLVEERAKRGDSVPLHRHVDDMESFFMLDGEIAFFIDNSAGLPATAGSFVHIPGGTIHGFRVESDTARYLILTTPRHGEFYRAITLASEPDGSSPLAGVDGATIKQACRDYGIEFISPLPL